MVYDKIDETLIPIQKWVSEHDTLPKIDTLVLKHFINVCNGNIQEIQKLIELHYSIRNSYSNLFIERDPTSKESQNSLRASDVIYLPKLTSDNSIIQISRISDPDPDKYNHPETVKTVAMVYDMLFRTIPETQIIDSVISIFDSANISLRHVSKISISALRGFMKFYEKGTAYKIAQIHVINCPSYINKIMAVLRPFMADHINKMINFHQPNSQTLFKYISKDLLPIEFGGTGESLELLRIKQRENLIKHRDYLIDLNYWKHKDKIVPKIEKDFQNLNLD
ncbi:clavesin-2-like [Condylostylus longicornis]|uniref:clavesin-2-like n=1 Tax=Condylostylus longicornis TaxID=2530218 RepID=UPI00244DCFE2|nr:clavesin-2-like [Condylostylus longicornis]